MLLTVIHSDWELGRINVIAVLHAFRLHIVLLYSFSPGGALQFIGADSTTRGKAARCTSGKTWERNLQ
jgi:hypothetical protein